MKTYRTPLQTTAVQPLPRQPLHRVPLGKQRAKLAPQPMKRLPLQAAPLPTTGLAPLASAIDRPIDKPSLASSADGLADAFSIAHVSSAADQISLLAEQRLPLQGQGVALRPLTVATRPVKTRVSRPRRKN